MRPWHASFSTWLSIVPRIAEEGPDLTMERGLVVLDRQEVVGLVRDDVAGALRGAGNH